MTCVRVSPRLRRSLLITSGTETFFPASEWMPMTGITAIDFLMHIASMTSKAELKPALQIARTRTDKPDPGQAIAAGRFVDTVELHHFREVPDLPVGAFVRFGFAGRLRKGAREPSAVEAELDVAIKECGEVLGTKIVEVQPFAMGSDEEDAAVAAITDWRPTVGVAAVKGVFVLLDNLNEALLYRLTVRAAKDKLEPDAWVPLEGWNQPAAGNSERNTGELTVPAAAHFNERPLFQLGIAFRRAPCTERNPRCLIHTLTHCRYA